MLYSVLPLQEGQQPQPQLIAIPYKPPCIEALLSLSALQGLPEGQELPPELITALFEALSYDALLEGEPTS